MDRFILTIFAFVCGVLHNVNSSPPTVHELPNCDRDSNSLASLDDVQERLSLLIVSSLDGKITALDPRAGKTLWSHNTGPGPLLSSTISNIELTGRGEWVQLIPSLDGLLYKYNGKTLEPIPMTVETLLRSSFKLGDDMVITGGKESRSYGISLETGELKYECAMDGCNYFGTNDSDRGGVFLVKRETQAVRAVEPRSGSERWNFSVGEHQISFLEGSEQGCYSDDSGSTADDQFGECASDNCFESPGSFWDKVAIKVVVPEGLVVAVDLFTNSVIWSVKFEAPIVNAWYMRDGKMHTLDIFNWNNNFALHQSEGGEPRESPAIYVGSHNQQLYIQHSHMMRSKVMGAVNRYLLYSDLMMPQLEWNPDVVTSVDPLEEHTASQSSGNKDFKYIPRPGQSPNTALTSYRGIDNSYDHGYYLYENTRSEGSNNNSVCQLDEAPAQADEETLDQIIIGSLWYRWKEILAISVGLAVVLNMAFFSFLVKRIKRKVILENSNSQPIQIVQPASLPNDAEDAQGKETSSLPSSPTSSNDYQSRFLSDFESVQCLGKGGFGVVIEAKNKIDECSYAIKRICLPSRKDAREKVMREVKALAKLDHPSIVRYYNSWVESPPPGWQEEKDKVWECSSDIQSVTSVSPGSPVLKKPTLVTPVHDVNLLKPFDSIPGESSLGFVLKNRRNLELSRTRNENNNNSISFKSDSSVDIVFGSGSGDQTKSHRKKKSKAKNSVHKKGKKILPFQQYQESKMHSASMNSSIAFEDSGCADRSQSTDTEEIEFSLSKCFHTRDQREQDSSRISSSAARPSNLSIHSSQSTCTPKLFLYIQMQLCRKETLKDWLNANTVDRERYQVLDIFDQIVSAVNYVHSCGLMHRDLKPSNIFFSIDGTIKVGDFGLVTELTENEAHTPAGRKDSTSVMGKHTDQVGTQLYMSPEQISGLPYSHKVDIYSLGLIFFELLVPFRTQMERCNVLLNVRKHKFPEEFKKTQQEECRFVSQLLSGDPNKRPSAEEIKKHPLFKEFQPQPELVAREFRRRTLSQRFSSSSSDEIYDTGTRMFESKSS